MSLNTKEIKMTYFITHYNLLNLMIHLDENLPFSYSGFYKSTILTDFALKADIFPTEQAKALCIAQKLFKNMIKINQLYYFEKAKKDSKNWVYEINPPAYHKQNHCNYLLSEFENYPIPESCPEERCEEYRVYFKENIGKYGERDGRIEPIVFARKLKADFELTEEVDDILKKYVMPYIRKNSGSVEQNYVLSKNDILEQISVLRQYMQETGYSPNDIARAGQLLHNTDLTSEKQIEELKKIYTLRRTIFYSILNHYLFSLKENGLDVTEQFLKILGFRPCKGCC